MNYSSFQSREALSALQYIEMSPWNSHLNMEYQHETHCVLCFEILSDCKLCMKLVE
jgi:hypothetical protein